LPGRFFHNGGEREIAVKLEDSVKMTVGGLTLDPVTKAPIVLLRDDGNKFSLPIWVGLLEATAMATAIEGVPMPRPMTHDLLTNLLAELGAEVDCVEITALRENTYYALIHLRVGTEIREIDARPSDAIALALRTGSTIYVARAVIESSSVLRSDEEGGGDAGLAHVSPDKWSEILAKMDPEDFKYKM
jgi:bifunctional DNase/RNase